MATRPVPVYKSKYHDGLWSFKPNGSGPDRVILVPEESWIICRGAYLRVKDGPFCTATQAHQYASEGIAGFAMGD